MKASELLAHLRTLGVEAHVRRGRVAIRNAKALPHWLLQAVTAHRADLRALLVDGEDRDLTPVIAQRELRRFGFMQLETGAWCHPCGDEYGDRILMGLVDPQAIDAAHARARKEAIALGATPVPPQPVDPDVTEIHAGRYRWTEDASHVYRDPFPRIARIEE